MQTATGTHTRVQMQREGQALIPHGTLVSYDPVAGDFVVLFDFQPVNAEPFHFTPGEQMQGLISAEYMDQNGLKWTLVR